MVASRAMNERGEAPIVLVVDDSAVARLSLARGLKARGARVCERDSLSAVRDDPPGRVACAILDLELPDGDGVQVAELLRATMPWLPVAFFSAGAADAVLARARLLGPVHAKPGELAAVVAWATAQSAR